MEMKTGILVSVLRSAGGCDGTLGGQSSKYPDGVLVGRGVEGPFEPKPESTYILVERTIRGEKYYHAEPARPCPSNAIRMFGGNFLHSSDARFRNICGYPIPIHDRDQMAIG